MGRFGWYILDAGVNEYSRHCQECYDSEQRMDQNQKRADQQNKHHHCNCTDRPHCALSSFAEQQINNPHRKVPML